jgi:flagellar capping protein FliD
MPMTNEQLYLSIGVPMLFNAGLIGILLAYINAKFDANNQRFASIDQRFVEIDRRFLEIDRRLDAMDKKIDRRFDEMQALWRAELHRVEEVLDARLKHLEER